MGSITPFTPQIRYNPGPLVPLTRKMEIPLSSFAAVRTRVIEQVSTEARGAALEVVRTVLTEENTDAIITKLTDAIKAKLPWYAKFVPIGTVLDKLLPESLLRVFEDVLS